MQPRKPRFLLAENLNRLAKWLRLLGYDAAVYRSISTDKMINLAIRERRILLTRAKKIAARKEKFPRILIRSENHKQQLCELFNYISFDEKYIFSRCRECNKLLFDITKDKIKELVPEFIFNSQTEFVICRKCGKIFWRGTHYQNMMQDLKNIFSSQEC